MASPLEQMMALLLKPQQQAAPAGNPLLDILKQQRNPDPVSNYNRESNIRGGTSNPFDNGFFKNTAADLTPEAKLASQGMNGNTQWALAGGVQGVDPTKLRGLLDKKAGTAGSVPAQTAYGEVRGPDVSMASPAPQVGSWVQDPGGWSLVGPNRPGEGGGNVLQSIPNAAPLPNETPFGIMNDAPPAPRTPGNSLVDMFPDGGPVGDVFDPSQFPEPGPNPFGGAGFSMGLPKPEFSFGGIDPKASAPVAMPGGAGLESQILSYLNGLTGRGTPPATNTPKRRPMPPRGGF